LFSAKGAAFIGTLGQRPRKIVHPTGLTTTDTTPSLMINKAELMPRLIVDATLNWNLWIKESRNPLNSMRTKVGISFA
jgi:hypothetical protein